jgi:hypothetical protein
MMDLEEAINFTTGSYLKRKQMMIVALRSSWVEGRINLGKFQEVILVVWLEALYFLGYLARHIAEIPSAVSRRHCRVTQIEYQNHTARGLADPDNVRALGGSTTIFAPES